MLFQPRHYLEHVYVEVSSTRRRRVTAVPSTSRVGWVAYIRDAQAHYSHLADESRRNVHVKLISLCIMRIFKQETCWPTAATVWSSCWSNCGSYHTVSAEFRPLQAIASWYPEDPLEQRNLSGTYSSKVTSVGSLSVCLAFSTQLCLCRQQISYGSTLLY